MKKICTLAFLLFLGGGFSVRAQLLGQIAETTQSLGISIPEVALLDIVSSVSKNINLGLVAPTRAGDPVGIPTAIDNLWLNYSSILPPLLTARKVTIEFTGNVPPGLTVSVQAGNAQTTGGILNGGLLAGASSLLSLATTTSGPQTLLSGIGSGFTGFGVGNGHQLTYNLAIVSADYNLLKSTSSSSLNVKYTMTDL